MQPNAAKIALRFLGAAFPGGAGDASAHDVDPYHYDLAVRGRLFFRETDLAVGDLVVAGLAADVAPHRAAEALSLSCRADHGCGALRGLRLHVVRSVRPAVA